MDNFISTFVFLLPGFLMYFWIQSFGVNPAVKHSATEMGAMAALLWLPVSLVTIIVYNWIGGVYNLATIWTLNELKNQTGDLSFLSFFSFLSIPVSFLLSALYVKFIFPIQKSGINKIRNWIGYAKLSDTSTVWEEFFIQINKDRNQGAIPVKLYKLDKPTDTIIGLVGRASRPFETERALVLVRCQELQESHECYDYEVERKYIDLNAGLVVEELNLKKPTKNKED